MTRRPVVLLVIAAVMAVVIVAWLRSTRRRESMSPFEPVSDKPVAKPPLAPGRKLVRLPVRWVEKPPSPSQPGMQTEANVPYSSVMYDDKQKPLQMPFPGLRTSKAFCTMSSTEAPQNQDQKCEDGKKTYWSYNPKWDRCEPHKDICNPPNVTLNRFPTKGHCEAASTKWCRPNKWKTTVLSGEFCNMDSMQPLPGTEYCVPYTTPRPGDYYYDKFTQQCKQRMYTSSCDEFGATLNRFKTLETCKNAAYLCGPHSVDYEPEPGYHGSSEDFYRTTKVSYE